MTSITSNQKEKSLIIKYKNSKTAKIPYNPAVNIFCRFTKEELENMTKDKKLRAKYIIININNKERYLSLSELCQLVLHNRLSENDVVKNVDLYLNNEIVLCIFASALPDGDVLCIDKAPKSDSNFISPGRDFALMLS